MNGYSIEGEARWTAAQLDRYLAEQDRYEAAAEAADEEFGEGWEENSLDPEERTYVSYWDVKDSHKEF